ncbi:hypothetical protein EUX98_g7443, partial [Antrodiella citrinella]
MSSFQSIEVSPHAIRVLITGFGPFSKYNENPSWLAVKPLHNTILFTQPESNPVPYNDQMMTDEDVNMPPAPQEIHITSLEIPVTYKSVRTTVPGLHARPPILPQ